MYSRASLSVADSTSVKNMLPQMPDNYPLGSVLYMLDGSKECIPNAVIVVGIHMDLLGENCFSYDVYRIIDTEECPEERVDTLDLWILEFYREYVPASNLYTLEEIRTLDNVCGMQLQTQNVFGLEE